MNYITTYILIGILVAVVVSVKERQWELGLVAGAFWPVTLVILIVIAISNTYTL